MRPLALVVAMARNGAIGQGGKLPWHSPEDMAHFKELTMGRSIVMGRRTWESIPEKHRPLPGRINIVVASSPCEVGQMYRFSTFEEALTEAYHWSEEPFVIGGTRIYSAALHLATRLEVTWVDGIYPDADTFFPYDGSIALGPADFLRYVGFVEESSGSLGRVTFSTYRRCAP